MPVLRRWHRCLPLLALILAPSSGFFSWLMQSTTPDRDAVPPTAAPDTGGLLPVPFEMTTADERFLAEARQLDLSPLESCHHKVIAALYSSCTDLTEEELAKLGVSLFNCQSSIEGRKTYRCTTEMTLAECTAKMDPDTWNAYHIVSNRARAVCYATRQLQFKRQTEHTVNALVSTAVGQLEAMEKLKSGQQELKELTSESLRQVANGQQDLLIRQAKLQGSQEQVQQSIHSNLDQLAQEKALIASGQQQVAQLIEAIRRRMENVSSHLHNQDADLQEGHRAILKDLTQVQRHAQEVYSKIETNLGLFLAYQNQTAVYYDELMGKLQKMNQSLGLVLDALESMRSSVEGQLQHMQRFISWAGFSLSSIYTCILHGCYFLLAALMMTFLQIPGLPRAVLLVLVVANALSELNQAVSLGFKALTSLLVLTVAGNWLLELLCRCALSGRGQKLFFACLPPSKKIPELCTPEVPPKSATRCRITSTPDRDVDVSLLKEELQKLAEMSYVSDGFHVGRESPGMGEGAGPLPADWKPQSGHSIRSMSLRRVSLARSTRCELLEKQATLEGKPEQRQGLAFSPFTNLQACSPNDSMTSEVQLFRISKATLPIHHQDRAAVQEEGSVGP